MTETDCDPKSHKLMLRYGDSGFPCQIESQNFARTNVASIIGLRKLSKDTHGE